MNDNTPEASLENITPAGQSALCGTALAIDHIAIAVVNLEESISWYVGSLGFRLLERRTTRGESTGMISAVLVCGGIVVVLVQGTEPESQVSRFIAECGPGVQHIAFSVKNLDQAMTSVTAAGGAADTAFIEDVGIRQVFLRRDPGSGVRVELIERNGGDFSDRSVGQLFRAFESQNLY